MAKKIKKAQMGFSSLNPRNWGVTDLTEVGSFNKAFEMAKKANTEQFLWKGNRYNTKSNLTPKQQLKKYGIVDEQRLNQRGFTGKIRERLAENLYPFGYKLYVEEDAPGPSKRFVNASILNKMEEDRIEADVQEDLGNSDIYFQDRVDYNNLYFGKPQKYGTKQISDYKPSKSKDSSSIYYTSPNIKKALEVAASNPDYYFNDKFWSAKEILMKTGNTNRFKLGRGKDEKGEYISYYDIWDLAPSVLDGGGEDESMGLGKPFELYDRIYLKDIEPKEYKEGGKIMKNNKLSKSKAAEMLHNPPHGKKLTDKQRKFFAATAYGQQGLSMINPNSYSAQSSTVQPTVLPINPTNTNPVFPTKQHHDSYHKKMAVQRMQKTHPGLYERYLEHMAVGNTMDADAMIMAAGGIPTYKPTPTSSKPAIRSSILDVGFRPKKTRGYRYNSGAGKPDVESITPYEEGGVIKDNMGQWKHPGKITQISSPNITMEGVNYPVLGVSDSNDIKLMQPGGNYKFKGKSVTEYPLAQNGKILMPQDATRVEPTVKDFGKPQSASFANQTDLLRLLDTRSIQDKQKLLELDIQRSAENVKLPSDFPSKEEYNKWYESTYGEPQFAHGGGLKRSKDYGSKKKPYPSVKSGDFAGGKRSYPIPTKADAVDALRLAGLHGRSDVKAKVYKKYPELKKGQYGMEVPDYTQESFDPFYNQNINLPQQQQQPKPSFYNKIGGMQGIAQGVGAVGAIQAGSQYSPDDGNSPSGAQQLVGGFGPWGAAISKASQIGTNITDKSSNPYTGAIGTTIFDPASAWTNKDLSKSDRVIGGLIPMYGGFKATQARNEKKRKQKELERVVQEAAGLPDTTRRRYIRPEDQIVDPNELYSSYGTGTSYLKKGGIVPYEQGGEITTHWGGKAEIASENPYLPGNGESVLFKGDSHAEGGIGMTFGKSKVEVEGGEPAVKLQDGKDESLVVFGDMKIPSYGVSELMDPKAKGKKFKNYVNGLNELENKQNKTVEKGTKLVNDTPIIDSFDKLKVSSGKAMIEGGNMKLKEIAAKKQIAANVQNAILETAEELGLKSDELAKGRFKKAKNGANMKYQYGGEAPGNYVEYIDPVAAAVLRDQLKGATPAINPGWGNYGIYYDPNNQGKTTNPVASPIPTPPAKRRVGTPAPLAQKRAFPSTDNLPIQGGINTDYFKNVPSYGSIPETSGLPQEYTEDYPSQETSIQPQPSAQGNQFDWMSAANSLLPLFRPTNQRPLDPNQLAGERYALATNQLESVQAQLYNPLLENVSDISLQDQLNANQADFNSLARQTAQNPAAQSALAAQKYEANSKVLGEQFRLNQSQKMGVFNRNRGILNDATLKNLAILDQQYVRQSQAKSNTKAVAQQAINSISDKIAKNKLENRTLGVYENLYNYRYDNRGRAWNWNGFAQFNVDNDIIEVDKDGKVVLNENKVKRDRYGIVTESTQTSKEQQRRQSNKSSKSNKNGGIVKAMKGY